jgi:hypothetical protein
MELVKVSKGIWYHGGIRGFRERKLGIKKGCNNLEVVAE